MDFSKRILLYSVPQKKNAYVREPFFRIPEHTQKNKVLSYIISFLFARSNCMIEVLTSRSVFSGLSSVRPDTSDTGINKCPYSSRNW